LRSFRFFRKSPASNAVMSTSKLAVAPAVASVSGSATISPPSLLHTVVVSWTLDRALTVSVPTVTRYRTSP